MLVTVCLSVSSINIFYVIKVMKSLAPVYGVLFIYISVFSVKK